MVRRPEHEEAAEAGTAFVAITAAACAPMDAEDDVLSQDWIRQWLCTSEP
jgi:hypothetical protein